MEVTLERVVGPEAMLFWPYLLPGVLEWASSQELELAPARMSTAGAVSAVASGLSSGVIALHLIKAGERVVGFDLVRDTGTAQWSWLEGLVTWLEPEARGQGVWAGYLDTLMPALKARGLTGFQFTSTLDRWVEAADGLHLALVNEQEVRDGIVARTFVRRAT